jgi:hypothetical protein
MPFAAAPGIRARRVFLASVLCSLGDGSKTPADPLPLLRVCVWGTMRRALRTIHQSYLPRVLIRPFLKSVIKLDKLCGYTYNY